MDKRTPSLHPTAARREFPRWAPAIALAFICLLFALPLSAQFDTGTIAGSVTDSSGAVIPHATVTITNTGTGLRKTLQTDTGGNFAASALPFGTYVVAADVSNFAQANSQQIVLNVGATVHVNLTMNVAAANQIVEVTGTATTVDTA